MIKQSAAALAVLVVMATAQEKPEKVDFLVEGYSGQANVVRSQGRFFIDVQDLARITNGSLTFTKNRIVLTLAQSGAAESQVDGNRNNFSPAFMRAAIEAMASVREWGGMLKVIVENGYPVGKAMAGNTIRAYEGRAADRIALAAAAASTDSDHRGLELLRNEFSQVHAWAGNFVEARNEMRAVDLTTSEHPLKDDEEAQRIMDCGEFLAQMFASGAFQDNAVCH